MKYLEEGICENEGYEWYEAAIKKITDKNISLLNLLGICEVKHDFDYQ